MTSGATWTPAQVAPPKNRFDWQRWSAKLALRTTAITSSGRGRRTLTGRMQPHSRATGIPQGYGGNALHRVAVLVG
jgi:hypothetical protein